MAKKKINSKGKGSGYERRVCRLLDTWWQPAGQFVRTKNLQVVGTDKRIAHGDVACLLSTPIPSLDPEFPFSVECKKREGWDFLDLLKDNRSGIHGWWNQCKLDAERWEKIPLLIFTKNHSVDCVAFPTHCVFPKLINSSLQCQFYYLVPLDGIYVTICTWFQFTSIFTVKREVTDIV